MNTLKFRRTLESAKAPVYATPGAACMDLHAAEIVFQGAETMTIRTGLEVEIPEGWCLLIFSRSGHGFSHNTRLANCVGVIDSDYRGEVMVKLRYDREWDGQSIRPKIDVGSRVAQALMVRAPIFQLQEVSELSTTIRGSGGFGSTGS